MASWETKPREEVFHARMQRVIELPTPQYEAKVGSGITGANPDSDWSKRGAEAPSKWPELWRCLQQFGINILTTTRIILIKLILTLAKAV